MMKTVKNYKYLDDLGIDKEDQFLNWFDSTKGDTRESQWEEERSIYGIDERETWNWDKEFMDYCYIHLKMYNQVNKVVLTYHKVKYGDGEINVQEAIDKILNWFETEYYPERGDFTWDDKLTREEMISRYDNYVASYTDAMHLLVDIMPYLWW